MLPRYAAPPSGRIILSLYLCCMLAVAMARAHAATIEVNFTGVTLTDAKALNPTAGNGGYGPPDADGAVGPNNVVQLINGAFAVYDRSGNPIGTPISGRDFWSHAHVTPSIDNLNLGVFNQRILYDPTAGPGGRWIAAGLTTLNPANTLASSNLVLLARSDTPDPTGTWQAASFTGLSGKFVDYTALGVDANGVYISTDNYSPALDSVSVFSVPKADLFASTPSLTHLTPFNALSTSAAGFTVQPVINFGPATNHEPLIATTLANPSTQLYRTDLTGTSAANAAMSVKTVINVAQYSNPPAGAQPDRTRSISTIDDRIASNVYQIGNILYAVHSTTLGGNSAITWLKIDEQTNQVIQEGVLSDPNFDYFHPSVAANANGDVVIGFTRSGFGANGNLSAFAAIGKTSGGVTTFGTAFLLKASSVGNYHFASSRWGDYSTTVVDPTDPNMFWTFQEYALASNAWATQITQIFVPEPSSMAQAAAALAALATAAWRRRRMGC